MVLQPELALIVLAALLPPLALATILAARAPRTTSDLVGAALAFVWGATVATAVATVVNDAAAASLPDLIGAERAHRLLPALFGPTVEELAKAAGFLALLAVARPALGEPHAAMRLGAIVGLGFAAAENVGYYTLAGVQGGWSGLGRAVYLRGLVQSGNHAAFTAVAGAGIDRSASPGASGVARLRPVAFALLVAIVLHALWNTVVSPVITDVLCRAPAQDAACAPAPDLRDLLGVVPALEAAFLAPILVGLGRLARRHA